jgi:hypothetical protein
VAVWGDAGLPGLAECDEALGGDGCPRMSAFAPEPFAAALGVPTTVGMQLLGDTLDLAYRLPRTWAAVRALAVPAWKARRPAQATHHLPREAAAMVDARLAHRLDAGGTGLTDRMVAQVVAMLDPASQAEGERSASESWDVTIVHRTDGGWAGTSHLEATGDTLDLTRFYDVVCDHAARLAALGDPASLGARKAKALGAIADAQSQLDLFGTRADPEGELGVRRPSLAKTGAYLHFSLTDLVDDLDSCSVEVGEVERLGPATLTRIREWLGETRATIVPVLDLGRDDAVDQHDPPTGCVRLWSCATGTASPPGAIVTPDPATSTTSSRTSSPTRADHPARPGRRRWHRCAGGTTAPRHRAGGATAANATAPTHGRARTVVRSPSAATSPGLPIAREPEPCLFRLIHRGRGRWSSLPRAWRAWCIDVLPSR